MICSSTHMRFVTGALATIATFFGSTAHAGSQWWDFLTPVAVASTTNTDLLMRYGEQWWNDQWRARGALYRGDGDNASLEVGNHLSVDLKRRLFSNQENSFLAIGVGWDDIELPGDLNTSGMRLVAEGRYSVFGPAYVFGQAAYTPWLSEINGMTKAFGREVEFGLAINPYPSMSLKAGYRNYWLDSYDEDMTAPLYDSRNNGLFIGGGINW